jgi:hypothetical protein
MIVDLKILVIEVSVVATEAEVSVVVATEVDLIETEKIVRCFRLFVINVELNVNCLLDQLARSRFIAVTVLKKLVAAMVVMKEVLVLIWNYIVM